MHPGHGSILGSGAIGILNEGTEARKVTKRVYEILKASNVPAIYYEDNISTNQTANINNIVKPHNTDRDSLIVSIHFNASASTSSQAIATAVLYYGQKDLVAKVSQAISNATGGGLLKRGAKQCKDLAVLVSTYERAILIDASIYRRDF